MDLTLDQAAEFLEKRALQAASLTKQADLAASLGVGGGLGAAAGLLTEALRKKKRKNYLQQMLLGGATGAGIGGLYHVLTDSKGLTGADGTPSDMVQLPEGPVPKTQVQGAYHDALAAGNKARAATLEAIMKANNIEISDNRLPLEATGDALSNLTTTPALAGLGVGGTLGTIRGARDPINVPKAIGKYLMAPDLAGIMSRGDSTARDAKLNMANLVEDKKLIDFDSPKPDSASKLKKPDAATGTPDAWQRYDDAIAKRNLEMRDWRDSVRPNLAETVDHKKTLNYTDALADERLETAKSFIDTTKHTNRHWSDWLNFGTWVDAAGLNPSVRDASGKLLGYGYDKSNFLKPSDRHHGAFAGSAPNTPIQLGDTPERHSKVMADAFQLAEKRRLETPAGVRNLGGLLKERPRAAKVLRSGTVGGLGGMALGVGLNSAYNNYLAPHMSDPNNQANWHEAVFGKNK